MIHNQIDFYRASRCITRQQKIKLLQAVQQKSINLQDLKNFAGLDFYRVKDHFICRENLQKYSYEEILKINDDLPTIPDAAGMIEFKAMENGEIIVNGIVIMPISEDEILQNLL